MLILMLISDAMELNSNPGNLIIPMLISLKKRRTLLHHHVYYHRLLFVTVIPIITIVHQHQFSLKHENEQESFLQFLVHHPITMVPPITIHLIITTIDL